MNAAPPRDIAPASGKLGVLLVGLGAVATTTIAGVLAIRNGLAQPSGSHADGLMKLKNTLRYVKGEELVTYLGREYYD